MNDPDRQVHFGFGDQKYPAPAHACYLYCSDDERRQMLPLFVQKGAEERHYVEYFGDLETPIAVREMLGGLCVNCDQFSEAQFKWLTSKETYCPDGRFDPDRMLGRLTQVAERGRQGQFAGVRIAAEMTWALRGCSGHERLAEYESRINEQTFVTPTLVICQYDTRRFDGRTLADIVAVHPLVIMETEIIENPHFVDTRELLGIWT